MKLALLGPGQASQYVEMGKSFYDNYEIARDIFELAEKISGIEVKKLCFEGPEELLTRTDNVQVCITAVSAVSFEVLKKETELDIVALGGHSLGEYAALYAAGVFDLETLFKAVSTRGKAMQEAAEKNKGGMIAVIGLNKNSISEAIEPLTGEGIINVANINSEKQIILSGQVDLLEKAADILKEKKAKKIVPLKVSGPWHSSFMEPAADVMNDVLAGMALELPQLPVFSNVTAGEYPKDINDIKDLLVKQITSPVNWSDEINEIQKKTPERYIELAPNKVLKGIMRQIDKKINVISFDNVDILEELK